MRIIYYFNEREHDQTLASNIIDKYFPYELIFPTLPAFKGLLERLKLPQEYAAMLVVVNDGALEAVWRL